ncbi:MAG: translation initiation factor IF-2 subunit gamma [archaeon]
MVKKKAKEDTAGPEKKRKSKKKEEPSEQHKPAVHDAVPHDAVQPEINIGLVGHVDHGKTTLTQALSGKWTDTHSEEMKRGITIRLGYADMCVRRIKGLPEPECFTTKEKGPNGEETEVVRKISFVDAPGHESLMATMLSGANIMDGALLLVAANETCPQPQTREHLMALEICGIKNVIIVQNKIDLVSAERAQRHFKQIQEFIKGTPYEHVPIIPLSAQHNVNTDLLLDAIQKCIPTPERKEDDEFLMFIARSFDLNKPGTAVKDIKGGVLGGSVATGKITKGETIEIRPGQVTEEHNQIVAKPIMTVALDLVTGGQHVDHLSPGGSVAILTDLDPSIIKGDAMTGNLVGRVGKLPPVWHELTLQYKLLDRVVGSKEDRKVDPLKLTEMLMINVNSCATVGIISGMAKDTIKCKLRLPVCAAVGARVTLSRRVEQRFRLIGYGIIKEK